MKTLVILAHPHMGQSVVNKAWINSLPKDKSVIDVHDLYETYPDWQIDVVAEQQLLEQHDRIVFQFPIFWFNMPPLLKKWMDEVLAYGWCYGPDGNKMEGKEIGAVVSVGGPAAFYQMGGQNLYTLDRYLSFLEGTANFIRAKHLPCHAFYGAETGEATEDALMENAKKYLDYLSK